MNGDNRIRFNTEAIAEDSSKYDDMRLRLLIRQAVLNATSGGLELDEAIEILENEALYMKNRIKGT